MSKYYLDIVPIGTKGVDNLTYSFARNLRPGQLALIPYGNKEVFGLVANTVDKPEFPTKEIVAELELPPLPAQTLDLAKWLARYYAAGLGDCLRLLVPPRPDINSRPAAAESNPKPSKNLTLTDSQAEIVDTILKGSDRSWLVHGATGSGKTAVYIELCRKMLSEGKSAIVLVPEITLTTQMIDEFQREIPNVAVTHSGLSQAKRRAVWRQALMSDQPLVMIGPRSSLFMPVSNLGLIVIDECHETSYKQEQSPNYHARDAGAKLAHLTDAKLVLGSATPSTHDIFLAQNDRLKIVELPEPIHLNPRTVSIVDIRRTPSIISEELQLALRQNLAASQQSLLFLNRRGSASQVVCADCGLVSTCPDCQIPLTWHGDIGKLQCHWCGRKQTLSPGCSQCSSLHRRFLGVGTKRVESEIVQRFPDARVLRLDRDSFSPKTISATIDKLKAGEVDILIGTQMIAKGLDLPQVSLVGVILADTMLHIPDLYSSERTYQLLHQVIGRAGRRADQPAQVIIQTYSPDHPAIQLASRQDFQTFMKQELAERKTLGYPPYRFLAKLSCKRKTRAGAKRAADQLAGKLAMDWPDVHLLGPAPAWRENLAGSWYWHIILTSPRRQRLVEIAESLPANWRVDLDPVDLL